MKKPVIPYTLPEEESHSLFFIHRHIRPAVETRLHRHEAWELYCVTCGRGHRVTGDSVMSFAEGDVVLIPPSMPHCWEYDPASVDCHGEISYIMAAFRGELIEQCRSVFPEARDVFRDLTIPKEAMKFGRESSEAIRMVLSEMTEADPYGRLCGMLRLLPEIFMASDRTSVGRPIAVERDINRMQQVSAYVMAHYMHHISLDDIAAYTGMNRTAFCNFFRRIKGITFSQYVMRYRLETAVELLRTSRRQVSEICYAVGFNDIPHFCRTFKKAYGVAPSAIRRKMC